jgi:hypothetical protein
MAGTRALGSAYRSDLQVHDFLLRLLLLPGWLLLALLRLWLLLLLLLLLLEQLLLLFRLLLRRLLHQPSGLLRVPFAQRARRQHCNPKLDPPCSIRSLARRVDR